MALSPENKFLTPAGLKQINKDCLDLKIDSDKTREAISNAREQGDLSENEEFHASNRRLKQITEEIFKLEDIRTNSRVIDPKEIKSNKVQFGATVTIQNIDSEEKRTYLLVDTYESDPNQKKISIHSPIAKPMLNLSVGEFFSAKIRNKLVDFEILKIEYK